MTCCRTLTAARLWSGAIATSPMRFAAAAVIAEQMESRLANGEQIDIAEHAQLASTLVRIAQRIGINRRAKNITPALPDYLDAVEAEAEAAS